MGVRLLGPGYAWEQDGQRLGDRQLRQAARNGMTREPSRVGDGSNPTIPHRLGFCGGPVPTQSLTHERLQSLKFRFERLNHDRISHVPNATH